MKELENKVAIVTGAGSGIGRGIALIYAENGAKVVVSDINEPNGNNTVSEINAMGGEAIFVKADTSSPEDNENLVNNALEVYGGLHVSCNNAGIGGPLQPVGEYPVDGWNNVIGINLTGVFLGMRYQIPAMLKSGEGAIVNIASVLGMVATKNAAGYVAAKHGVVGLTKTAALEYSNQNIRINAVGPGYINTPLLQALDDTSFSALTALHPIGRLGEANEVAELVLWLSIPRASFVTGAYIPVDGGYLAQ